jgi:hypothetical protein
MIGTTATTGAASPRRRSWPIGAVVAVLALTVAVLVALGSRREPAKTTWNRPLEPVALLEALHGKAEAARGDERRALRAGETLYTDEVIETGSGATLSMKTYPVEARVELGGGSKVELQSPAEVRVEAGRVRAEVGSAATVFVTPHGRVLGQETELSLEVKPGGTEVKVGKGSALVDLPGGRKQGLEAGGRLVLAGAAAP